MKRLIWIAADDQLQVFDDLWSSLDILPRYYNISQIPNLSTFVARSKVLVEADYFVVDLTDAAYTADQLIEATKMLSRLSAARPIFLAPDREEFAILCGRLANEGIRNIIRITASTPIADEIRLCLSDAGQNLNARLTALHRGMAAQAKAQVQPFTIPDGLCVCCSVAGAMPRIGTSTQAILLCHYLHSVGFSPLLIDPSRHLYDALLLAYPDRAVEYDNYLELGDLCICTELNDSCASFNAYIMDHGVLSDDLQSFQSSDFRLLVTGIKPWELSPFASTKKKLQHLDFATCISFGTADELTRLQRYFGTDAQLAPWHPDPLALGDTSHLAQLLLPWLREICHA